MRGRATNNTNSIPIAKQVAQNQALSIFEKLSSGEADIDACKNEIKARIPQFYNDAKSKSKPTNLCVVEMTRDLAFYIIFILYEQKEKEYGDDLVSIYKQNKLHFYSKNLKQDGNASYKKQALSELGNNKLYDVLSNCFAEIFKNSFPLVEYSQASKLASIIKDSINELNEEVPNDILVKLTTAIFLQLDSMLDCYPEMHQTYKKLDDSIDDKNSTKNDLLEIEKELITHLEKMAENKCIVICSKLHSILASMHMQIMISDERNAEQHREKVIYNYKKMREYVPGVIPHFFFLYEVKISQHEIHSSLQGYVENINKDVNLYIQRSKAKAKISQINSLNQSIYSNVEKYLIYIMLFYSKLPQKEVAYDDNKLLSENLVKRISERLEFLLVDEKNEEAVANSCCVMEQLLNGSELRKLPEIYNALMCEILYLKIRAFRIMHDKNWEYSFPFFVAYRQYVAAALYLKEYPQYVKYDSVDDGYLTQCITTLISENKRKENKEKVKYYTEKGLFLFPRNISLRQAKVGLEINDIASQIAEMNEQGVIKESEDDLMLIGLDEQIKKIIVPELPNKTIENKNINDEFKKIEKIRIELQSKIILINSDRENIQKLVNQYKNVLRKLNASVKAYPNVGADFVELVFGRSEVLAASMCGPIFAGVTTNLTQNDREEINKMHFICVELTEIYAKYKSSYQSLKTNIDQCEKNLNNFAGSEKRINLLVADMHNKEKIANEKTKKAEEVRNKKVEEEVEKARKVSEEKAKKAEIEKTRMAKVNAQKAAEEKVRKAKEEKLNAQKAEDQRIRKAKEEKLKAEEQRIKKENEEKLKTQKAEVGRIRKINEENLKAQKAEEARVSRAIEEEIREADQEQARNFEEARRSSILLNGTGIQITPNVLNMLSELDKELRSIGAYLEFKSSLTLRFSTYYYNENPDRAHRLPVNDIDIHISFNEKVNLEKIISIIYGKNFSEIISDQHYKQFIKNIDGIKIELTVAISLAYTSHEFLIMRMGKMQFSYVDTRRDNQGQILVKISGHEFVITLPEKYNNEYIGACKYNQFDVLQPDVKCKSYLYSIYKYANKLRLDPLDTSFSYNLKVNFSSEIISYRELFPILVHYFDDELHKGNKACYLELNEFIKKGIDQGSDELALPLIKAFYCGLILSGDYPYCRPLTDHELSVVTDICAKKFMERCRILNRDKNIYFSLEEEIKNIARQSMEEFYINADRHDYTSYPRQFSGSMPQKINNNTCNIVINNFNFYSAPMQNFGNPGLLFINDAEQMNQPKNGFPSNDRSPYANHTMFSDKNRNYQSHSAGQPERKSFMQNK